MDKQKIKALMLTDYYRMKMMYIVVLVILVCKMVYNFTSSAASGGCSYMMDSSMNVVVMLFVTTLFSADNVNGAEVFRRSLPYTYRELVMSRYLMPMTITAASLLTTLLCSCTGSLLCKNGISDSMPRELSFTLTVSVLGISLMPIIFYPLFFRYGYTRISKYFTVLGAAIIILSTMAGTVVGMAVSTDNSGPPALEAPVPVCIAAIAAVIVGYVISYRIAVKSCELCDAC